MTGHRIRTIAVTLAALLALGAGAASAHAVNVGGAIPGVLTLPDGTPVTVKLGNPLVQASGNGIAVAVHATALLRGRVRLSGTTAPGAGTVAIERKDELAGWVAVATATVARSGRFAVVWKPDRVGQLELRAVAGGAAADLATDDPAAPLLGVTVYRPGIASWYGPTSAKEAAETACGVPLTRWTLGVAHRTLPCGTQVAFYYKGHTLAVPVIDRGPFVTGRTWDLTQAAFELLGGGGEGLIRVGALPLPLPAPAPATATPARRAAAKR